MELLKTRIRHVPDFPKAGILFYDVTTLLRDPEGFKLAIDAMSEPYHGAGISLVVGIESRGFILGAAVADRIGAGFVPVRKVGKLPHATVDLVRKLGGQVHGVVVLIELIALNGRDKLQGENVRAVLQY